MGVGDRLEVLRVRVAFREVGVPHRDRQGVAEVVRDDAREAVEPFVLPFQLSFVLAPLGDVVQDVQSRAAVRVVVRQRDLPAVEPPRPVARDGQLGRRPTGRRQQRRHGRGVDGREVGPDACGVVQHRRRRGVPVEEAVGPVGDEDRVGDLAQDRVPLDRRDGQQQYRANATATATPNADSATGVRSIIVYPEM